MIQKIAIVLLLIFSIKSNANSLDNCKAILQNDTLTIENDIVFQKFLWNKGNLIRLSFGRKSDKQSIIASDNIPVFLQTGYGDDGSFKVRQVKQNNITPAYLEVEVIANTGSLQVKRVFRVVSGSPAIACNLFFKGSYQLNQSQDKNKGDLKNIEGNNARKEGEAIHNETERIRLHTGHWSARSVEFYDITDRNNTLVQEYERIPYRQKSELRGNLLLMQNQSLKQGFFILKEAPNSSVQHAYDGFDFTILRNQLSVNGAGILPEDINDSVWVRGYGVVLGIAESNQEIDLLTSLRKYQQTIRLHFDSRDKMIMMNTWGDRGQDRKVNEQFIMAELEAGAKLGISHFQIDDGWQTGKSANSAFEGGSFNNIWRNDNYWKPDIRKFPNGLSALVEKGKKLGIEVCLWFNPSPDNSLENWEKDANVLISLNKTYGIRTFKIDGVNFPDKKAEINFRKMLDKVVVATHGNVVFNLDVTAMRRGGYHLFNEYGNLFVENRYTDWANYYPFWTLRNLWMLSKYVPAQNLQMEFLNIWRNKDKYPSDDPLAPATYTFDYVFALTMMAQPLAWFEGTGLPEDAFKSSGLIKTYRKIQSDIHQGIILPVGNEPDGYSWTGFQSIQQDKGYLLVIREKSDVNTYKLKTWLKPGTKIKFENVLGSGKPFVTKTGESGSVEFKLNQPNSFALFKYTVL